MDYYFKDNIKFISLNNENELQKEMLTFIFSGNAKKILYKGNPKKIDYKTLKKIMPLNSVKFDKNIEGLEKFIVIDKNKELRDSYNDFINQIESDLCIIHKL